MLIIRVIISISLARLTLPMHVIKTGYRLTRALAWNDGSMRQSGNKTLVVSVSGSNPLREREKERQTDRRTDRQREGERESACL